MESLWSLLTVLGPLLLLGVLAWAVLRNRKVTPRETAQTERATEELREEIDAEVKRDEAQR